MLTWNCDVCGCLRPDDKISVHKTDVSKEHKLPEGTMFYNAKYCNDNPKCRELAPTIHRRKMS